MSNEEYMPLARLIEQGLAEGTVLHAQDERFEETYTWTSSKGLVSTLSGTITTFNPFLNILWRIVSESPLHPSNTYIRADLVEAMKAENERLRAALGHSQSPCVYCSLPADEFAKCQLGFPGCGRADDMMGCPHLGSAINAHNNKKRIELLEKALEGILDGSIPISSNRESIKITVGGDEVVFNEEGNKSKNVQDAIEWVLTQLKEKTQ